MWQKLIRTDDDKSPDSPPHRARHRCIPARSAKALGWFGGFGYTGTMGFLTGMMTSLSARFACDRGGISRAGFDRRLFSGELRRSASPSNFIVVVLMAICPTASS